MKGSVAVAISGGGRTLENLLLKEDSYQYRVRAVISSSTSCKGLQIAQDRDLPVFIASFPLSDNQDLNSFLKRYDIDVIALAGFLKPFPVLDLYKSRIVNIHPALLPRYGGRGMYGRFVHQSVKESGDAVSGPTIHLVNEEYDKGDIIAQAEVDISREKDAEGIANRVFNLECKLYPIVLDYLVKVPVTEYQFPLNIEEL